MRDAYSRYAEVVPNPIKFDSFRRWITEGRIWSKKDGRFKLLLENSLDAFIRVHAKPLGVRIGDAFLANKTDGPMLLITVEEELANEKGGTVPEGSAWTGEDGDGEVFGRIIDAIHEIGDAFDKDIEGFTYDDNGRTFKVFYKHPAAVIALDTMAEEAEKMAQAVCVSTFEWMLDWLESKNVVTTSLDKDGGLLYSAVPSFKKHYMELEAEGKGVSSPRGEAKVD